MTALVGVGMAIGVGVAMGVAIAAPVGPVAALCIERTFSRGLRVALVTALGAGLADCGFGAIAALGIGFVTDWVKAHEVHLRVLGAIVLLVLAVNAWRKRNALALRDRERNPARDSVGALAGALASGFLLTASSPVTIVTFAVALASFGGEAARSPMWVPAGVLAGSAGWYGAVSVVAHIFRERAVTERGAVRMDRVGVASAIFLFGCAAFSVFLAVRAL